MRIEIEFKNLNNKQQEAYLHDLIDSFVHKMNVLGLIVTSYNKPKVRKDE